MNSYKKYIFAELKRIEKDCREQNITASEWIEKHAAEYGRRYQSMDREKVSLAKKGANKYLP